MSVRSNLVLRLILLAFVAVVIQQAAISQITLFGVSADVMPLVVMSVGLSCGSMTGAMMGFGAGLLVDLVLVQTLGITSLLYLIIGYWSGRVREVQDPSHGLIPVVGGAAATAVAQIGMAILQFLLGVNSPVSGLLVQQVFVTVLINTLISLPVYAIVRRVLGRSVPEDPRRRRRRRYTTGGLTPLHHASERFGPLSRSELK